MVGLRGKAAFAAVIAFGLAAGSARGEEIAMEEANWDLKGREAAFVEYKGEKAVFLNNGLAVLKDREFKNGIIEFDIAFQEERGFAGVNFRVQDAKNYEDFYFRPHQPGKPDANQYTPAFNGLTGWQIYYGPQYSAPIEYRFGEWMHFRMIVNGDRAEMYLDAETPFLHIDDLLQKNVTGELSLASFFTGAYFANVDVTEDSGVELIGEPVANAPWPENLVEQWQVSKTTVAADDIGNRLDPAALSGFEWTALPVEENGIANLARINPRSDEADTVFVRLIVESDSARIRRFDYGYSDRATVFLNGAAVAGGDNTYRSRDYRYLGTVGLFDSVYLDLREGRNEIIFAVSEAFGGWAVTGRFPDKDGITVIAP